MSEQQTITLIDRTVRDKALELKDEICLLVMEGLREALKHPDLKLRLNAIKVAAPYIASIQGDQHLAARLALSDRHQQENRADANRVMEIRQQRAEEGLPNDSVAIINLPAQTKAPIPMRPRWLEDLGITNEG